MDRAAVQTRWDELDAARRQAGEAQRRIQEAGERVAAMRRELLDAEARPAPTGERRREVGGGPGVVATTLALFRLRLDVAAAGPYDTVLVDDVGASTLAEVLPAVAMASRTAVLLGDFLQPEAAPRGVPRRWPVRTCFSHCGIRTADDARGCPGCAVLSVKQPAPG